MVPPRSKKITTEQLKHYIQKLVKEQLGEMSEEISTGAVSDEDLVDLMMAGKHGRVASFDLIKKIVKEFKRMQKELAEAAMSDDEAFEAEQAKYEKAKARRAAKPPLGGEIPWHEPGRDREPGSR